jgi:hypothetical protein
LKDNKPNAAMPDPSKPLKNARYEAFARAMALGNSQTTAHQIAGFRRKGQNGEPSRVANLPIVSARIQWLQTQMVAQSVETAVTAASITAEVDSALLIAMNARQTGAIGSLLRLKAQLHGLLVEKQEVTTSTFNIDELDSVDMADLVRLRDRLIKQLPPDSVVAIEPKKKAG